MEANEKKIGPEALLQNIGKSIMFRAMVLSIIGHVVFTAATSVSLWKDWAYVREVKDDKGEVTVERPYLLKAPGVINAMKGAERKAEEEAKRKADAAAKAEAEAKAAAEKKEAEAKERDEQRKAAPAAKAEGGDAAAATDEKGEKKPPEVQPLPPKKDFELGDDLSLD